MATRPVVLVFQEFATLSNSPATPELNCLIAGPAYWIQDFPEDRANIKLATAYGNLVAAPATGVASVTTALTVADLPNNKVGAVLDPTSVRAFAGNAYVELAVGSDMTTTVGSASIGSAAVDFVAAGVQPLDVIVMTDGSNVTVSRTVITVAAHTLTVNNETPVAFSASAVKFRVQRKLADTELAASFLTLLPGTNQVTVNALATIPVSGVAKLIASADIYLAYRSLRQDLQDVKTLSSDTEILGQLGRIDARNPLAVGVSVALANTNTTVQYWGVGSNDLTGYGTLSDAIGGRKDVYAVVPLTSDISVLAMFKAAFVALADPDLALANGVPQKFRVVIGSTAEIPTTKTIAPAVATGATQVDAAASVPTTYHTLSTPGIDLVAANVQPGDTLSVTIDAAGTTRLGSYTVSQVLSATSLEVSTAIPGGAQSGNATINIKVGTSAVSRLASTAITAMATVVDSKLFIDLYDPAGTFIDSGVIPTDLLELPVNPTQTSFNTKSSFVIASVLSNQRLRIVDSGRNTPLVATELPHGVSRSSPATVIPATNTLSYRVTRTLDKAGQVTQIVAVAQSIKSRRVVNVWPGKCDVTDLVDGSLPRDPDAPTVAQPAGTQPGYYLACAVGGMTAGLPSQQGFTNLGIAGIKQIYQSADYFSDKNLSDISNGGWFVFQQETPQTLPYVVHQLTTDVSTLQSGEFSMVKNFDFVSLFYSDILDEYLGQWNVNTETISFIGASVVAGGENLRLRRKPRIGAPVIDAKLISLGASTLSADRIELVVQVTFPAPVNTVALHLVSA